MDVLKYADINPDEAKRLAQRLHRKKDDIPLVRKFFTVDKVEASDDERSIIARVSTNDRDRDGEVVEPKGIDLTNYHKNPCLLWAHRYDQPAIGKALWTKTDDKGLVCKFQFAPTQFADEIYELYKGGYQRAFSIGFIPLDFDVETKIHRKTSLLEVSAVPVPSNQDALVMEAYQKGIIKSDQLVHDLEIDVIPDAEIPVNKIVDDKNNPGISDLFTAIGNALNPPAQAITPVEPGSPPKPWYAVQDVFPIDFPNGHCIFTEYLPGRDINPTYRQKYTYADGRATLKGTRVEIVVAYRNKEAEVITKPETSEAYHRIPVSEGHEGHRIRTITISADKGIKALYCGDCKEIATYLFDVDKFTMAEAREWVKEHEKAVGITENSDGDIYGSVFTPIPPDIVSIPSVLGFKEALDIAVEVALLRQDVAAILARLPVAPEPITQASTPLPAPPPIVPEEITVDPEPEIEVDDAEPPAPDKSVEVAIEAYIKSWNFDKAIKEAVEVSLAKLRGKVI